MSTRRGLHRALDRIAPFARLLRKLVDSLARPLGENGARGEEGTPRPFRGYLNTRRDGVAFRDWIVAHASAARSVLGGRRASASQGRFHRRRFKTKRGFAKPKYFALLVSLDSRRFLHPRVLDKLGLTLGVVGVTGN